MRSLEQDSELLLICDRFFMDNMRSNLTLIIDGFSGILRSLTGLSRIESAIDNLAESTRSNQEQLWQIFGAIHSFNSRLISLEDRTVAKADELLAAVAQVGEKIGEVSVTLVTEAEEIKAALEASASKNDPAIAEAISKLDGFKSELGKIKDTAAGLIPNVETPVEPTEPTEPVPAPVEPLPVDLPDLEFPIEVTVPESGIEDAPALDLE